MMERVGFLRLRGASFSAAISIVVAFVAIEIVGLFGGGHGGIGSGRVLLLLLLWWEGFGVRRERRRGGWGCWVGWCFWWGREVGRTLCGEGLVGLLVG